jgi:hypothetical protein
MMDDFTNGCVRVTDYLPYIFCNKGSGGLLKFMDFSLILKKEIQKAGICLFAGTIADIDL